MRRALLFLFAVALLISGGYIFFGLFFSEGSVKLLYFQAPAVMFFLGGYILWADFIKGGPEP